ncbi:hypothetical protein FACS18942_00020 [Planctomycetales bacterium]|nr:hypothetical protein FACS18942_00020 [Planctomycetales bacterium]GHT33034.1 hypothetical protein FACS1894214_4950 [Planctomycetales bacterium]GHT35110.1 hypothetical protein FACS189427_03700 [Planctomycetales bacterium]
MRQRTYRVVTRGPEGEYRIRDYVSEAEILARYIKIGIDDCSSDLSLRGCPVFRGLIGPIPEDGGAVRYESPEVFEELTKEWSKTKRKKREKTKLLISLPKNV